VDDIFQTHHVTRGNMKVINMTECDSLYAAAPTTPAPVSEIA